MSDVVIEVKNLDKTFKVGSKKYLKAVNNINFQVQQGESIGIVGESGCGKTTLGRTIMGIYEPTAGEIFYNGEKINLKDKRQKKDYISKVQMIFQDPYASLNPRMTVAEIIAEGWNFHKKYSIKERKEKVKELLETVGLNEEHMNRFPHEFSGGQRQRIGIARALSMDPELIICDEPISALDVSIQAQVMNLLIKLQKEKKLTYIFIAHDLLMVRYISKNIMVMYLGHQMEYGPSEDIYYHPVHPYTEALFSAIPVPDPKTERVGNRIVLDGDIPSPINLPSGCPFRTRCKYAKEICAQEKPESRLVKPGHYCACHFPLLENL